MRIQARAAGACIVLGVICGAALAEPAPWYLWRSKVENSYACRQLMPETGWMRVAGPFKDSHCEKPIRVK
ncbi:hypothetical protein [Janthinobacterium sp.]|uniref:hypothetical protein n=1 Tax=Janthinobacterium sp. TaxID=1871054 RepID=UPI00293D2F89|nr:hypothetical protein [Janthinobacterium sp.]